MLQHYFAPIFAKIHQVMGQLPVCSFQHGHNSVDPVTETTELWQRTLQLFKNTVII